MATLPTKRQEKPYTIAYGRTVGVVVQRIDSIVYGQVRLTAKSFATREEANRWLGKQNNPPWLISEDGSAITIFSRGTAYVSYETPAGDAREIKMPVKVFMSMIDSGIHLFEDYHYGDPETEDESWRRQWEDDA